MSGETFYIKEGDTAPDISEVLYLGDDEIDLTGCTIKFHLTASDGTPKIANGDVDIVGDPTNATVVYSWEDEDTDTPGVFLREWEITFSNGKVLTVPNTDDDVGYKVFVARQGA